MFTLWQNKIYPRWRRKVLFGVILWLGAAIFFTSSLSAKEWSNIKGEHFLVYFLKDSDRVFAQTLLRKAEEYYRRIGDNVGYTRYTQFWTWDDRVKILLFPDQVSFLKETGLPAWSNGFAERDSQVFKSRVIMTFRQENEFMDGLLPHEISHLVLHDFIPEQNLPIWFDEGVAQLEENNKIKVSKDLVVAAQQQGQLIPLAVFIRADIRIERDPQLVKIFYAQSLSIVDFLLTQYGAESFSRLCRDLRDLRSFPDALSHAYGGQLTSVDDLEKKWLNQLSR